MKKLFLTLPYLLLSLSVFAQTLSHLNINPSSGSNPFDLVTTREKIYFAAGTTPSIHQLWAVDGGQPYHVAIDTNVLGSGITYSWGSMAVVNNTLYMSATLSMGNQLYRYDGPRDFVPVYYKSPTHPEPISLHAYNNKLYFSAKDTIGRYRELMEYDPATNITRALTKIRVWYTEITSIRGYNGKIYFNLFAGTNTGSTRWFSCYDPATDSIKTIVKGEAMSPTILKNKLYFLQLPGGQLFEIGTDDTVHQLTYSSMIDSFSSINTGYREDNSAKLTMLGNKLLIPGTTPGNNHALFTYNVRTKEMEMVDGSLVDRSSVFNMMNHNIATLHGNAYYMARINMQTFLYMYDFTGVKPIMTLSPAGGIFQRTLEYTEFADKLYFVFDSAGDQELYVFEDGPLSIKATNKITDITTYPNPAHDATTLEINLAQPQTFSITLTDVQGREVYNVPATAYTATQHSIKIPMQQLAAGTYFYRIANDKVLASGQVVKE